MTYQEKYRTWLDYAQLPDYLRQDLVSMDEKNKEDAFYTNLEFGTAGMRGYIGAGTNRINVYVVRQATEGLAKLVASKGLTLAKNAGLPLPMTPVTSLQNLPLNQLRFGRPWYSILCSKACVQHLNCPLPFAIIMPSLVSW